MSLLTNSIRRYATTHTSGETQATIVDLAYHIDQRRVEAVRRDLLAIPKNHRDQLVTIMDSFKARRSQLTAAQ